MPPYNWVMPWSNAEDPGPNPGAPGPNPNEEGSQYENTPAGWAAYKAKAQVYRGWVAQRQKFVDEQLSFGATPQDLGIYPEKEKGLAAWNRLNRLGNEGLIDQSFEYDWTGGMKKNVATSWRGPEGERAGWIPITAAEKQQKQYQGGFGEGIQGYMNRLRQEQGTRFMGWQGNNLEKRGDFYFDPSAGGQERYYDPYGAIVDPTTGQRIGGAYATPGFSSRASSPFSHLPSSGLPGAATGYSPSLASTNSQANLLASSSFNPFTSGSSFSSSATGRPFLKKAFTDPTGRTGGAPISNPNLGSMRLEGPAGQMNQQGNMTPDRMNPITPTYLEPKSGIRRRQNLGY